MSAITASQRKPLMQFIATPEMSRTRYEHSKKNLLPKKPGLITRNFPTH
jgi:hypothetical protein